MGQFLLILVTGISYEICCDLKKLFPHISLFSTFKHDANIFSLNFQQYLWYYQVRK